MDTPRHTLEVDYHPFRRALLREIPKDAPAFPRRRSRDAPRGKLPSAHESFPRAWPFQRSVRCSTWRFRSRWR